MIDENDALTDKRESVKDKILSFIEFFPRITNGILLVTISIISCIIGFLSVDEFSRFPLFVGIILSFFVGAFFILIFVLIVLLCLFIWKFVVDFINDFEKFKAYHANKQFMKDKILSSNIDKIDSIDGDIIVIDGKKHIIEIRIPGIVKNSFSQVLKKVSGEINFEDYDWGFYTQTREKHVFKLKYEDINYLLLCEGKHICIPCNKNI